MKKILLLLALITTIGIAQVSAQGGDPAQMAQRYKERVKPQLLEKVKLTDEQAEKVLDIQLASRQGMRGMRDLSPEERKKKMDEMQTEADKQYKAIPLTDDQVKAVNAFFEEMRQNSQGRGGGRNR